MLDMMLLAQATVITCAASILQGAAGYGFGLVAVPLLLIVDVNFVPAPLILASLFVMLQVAARNRFALEGHTIWPVLAGLLLGAPLGAYLLTLLNNDAFVYLVAVAVGIGLAVSMLGLAVGVNSVSQALAGVLASVFGTATGLGGAPLALLYQNDHGARIRAVLSTSFLFGSLMSFASLWWIGRVSPQTFTLTAYLLPGVFIGSYIGGFLAPHLDKGFSRAAILGITGVSLCYLLIGPA